MAKIISMINWKGGVGKTTLTYHIGTGITHLESEEPPRVLLVDLDPQCSLSISCLHEDNFEEMIFDTPEPIKTVKDALKDFFYEERMSVDPYDYIIRSNVRKSITIEIANCYENIDLLPSHPDLIYTDMEIAQLTRPSFENSLLLKDAYKFKFIDHFLSLVKDDYDYIFIDCPPNLNFITQNAIYASDYYIIPTHLDKLCTYGIISITNKISDLNKSFKQYDRKYHNIELLGIIKNGVVETGGGPKATQHNCLKDLEKSFPKEIIHTHITNGDGISAASQQSLPVYSLNTPNAQKQTKALLKVTEELVTLMSQRVNKK